MGSDASDPQLQKEHKTNCLSRSYFGRRTLYLGGLLVLMLLLVGIGGAGFAPANDTIIQTKRAAGPTAGATGAAEVRVNVGASWAVGSLLLIFTLIYDITVGPVCYAIVAETSSTRLRQKTIVVARMTYNICGVINNFLLPVSTKPFQHPSITNFCKGSTQSWSVELGC